MKTDLVGGSNMNDKVIHNNNFTSEQCCCFIYSAFFCAIKINFMLLLKLYRPII